jgi:hypothetical protein
VAWATKVTLVKVALARLEKEPLVAKVVLALELLVALVGRGQMLRLQSRVRVQKDRHQQLV